MSWDTPSFWDEPVDGDDSTAKSSAQKKLSWWEQFESDRDAAAAERADVTSYSYREAFDDSDSRWYRKNSFQHSRYSDYSPSRLFQSKFSSFTSDYSYGGGDNKLKNKAVRALRVLTRNANTVADKKAKISYVIRFSDGGDNNQLTVDTLAGKSGKQQEQVIFVSPDVLANASTQDENDAAVDALTGFVLLRVQIAQTVPAPVIDQLNAVSMRALPRMIAEVMDAKTATTAEDIHRIASTTADKYSAGLIAKNLITRLARRGVVQDWGGFAPYFVRHAKKFAAVRETLTAEDAVESVELLAAQIAYNMLADDNAIPLEKEVEAIVEKHLSAELPYEAVLPACQSLVADLRAYLAAKTEQPANGEIESAIDNLLSTILKENTEALSGDIDEAMRNKLEEFANTLDMLHETYERNRTSNRFADVETNANEHYKSADLLDRLLSLKSSAEQAASTIDVTVELARKSPAPSAPPVNIVNTCSHNEKMLRCGRENLIARQPTETAIAELLNDITPKQAIVLTPSGEETMTAAGAYAEQLRNMAKEIEKHISNKVKVLRNDVKNTLETTVARLDCTAHDMKALAEAAEKLVAETAKLSLMHAKGGIVNHAAQILQRNVQNVANMISADQRGLAARVPKLKRMRTPQAFKSAATATRAATNNTANALWGASELETATRIMRYFANAGRCAYRRVLVDDSSESESFSTLKIPRDWHEEAIDGVMDSDGGRQGRFDDALLAAAHENTLNKLLKKLTKNGKTDLPNRPSSSDLSEEQRAALERVAAGLGMSAAELLEMLLRVQSDRANSCTNATAGSIGKKLEEGVMALAAGKSPVDEELFGEEVGNSTTMTDADVVGVNEEALNRAEEDFVAFLSHNAARPTVVVKKPRKATSAASAMASAIKKRNRRAIASIRDALRFQGDKRVGEIHGLLSGDLDEGSLHKLRYDSEHIWSQKTLTRLPDVAVGILVDQSGSMSCGSKIANAREMCVVLAEAVKQIEGVHLHIYGHTANQNGASDMTLFEHYSSYGDARAADLSNLGGIGAYSNNYDGYAIKEAAKRLNEDPAKRKYLFVIADGLPSGSGYSGAEAQKHVTSVCTYVRTKLHIPTYAFAVGNDHPRERKQFEEQYGKTNVVFISTVNEALPRIVRFLRNTLQREKTLVDVGID